MAKPMLPTADCRLPTADSVSVYTQLALQYN
jgi:hypothetical protein